MNEEIRDQDKRKILLVEDEAIIAMDQARIIEEFGYRVVTAFDGEEAVVVINTDREIDLVLMDIDLGQGIDGTEAARRILEIRTLPVVFLTSHAEKEMVDRVKNITRYGYVLKNSGKFVLNEAITMAFELYEAHNEAQRHREETEVTNEELRVAIEEMEATNEEFEAANEQLIRSEQDLLESKLMFQELFNNMGNGVAIYEAVNDGEDFVFKEINKAVERIEQVKREDVTGKSVTHVFPGVIEFGLFDVFKRVWKTGKAEVHPVRQYADGRISGWKENYVYRLPSGEVVAVYQDITEIKQAEEKLGHQKRVTDHVMAVSPVSITIVDANGEITYANKRAEEVLGLKKEDITDLSYDDPDWEIKDLDGGAFPESQLPFTIVRQTGKPVYDVRHSIEWPGGKRVALSINASPLYDDNGDFTGMVATLDDITREKETGDILEREKEVKDKLLEASQYVLQVEDFDMTARHVFDACCLLTGATSGYVALLDENNLENDIVFLESGGMDCAVDPNLPMPVRGLRARAYESGRTVYHNDFMSTEYMKMMPRGHVPLYNVMFAPLNISGKTVGLMGIANKPTPFTEDDVRIAEAFGDLAAIALRNSYNMDNLAESEKRFRDMAELMPEILFEMDLHGAITFVNRMAFEITGYSRDDFESGINAFSIFSKDEQNVALERFREIIQSREPRSREYTVVKKDGTTIPVKIHAVSMVQDEKVTGIRGIIVDISEQKKVQEEKEKLVEEKELILHEVHHRIKNDMNVLRSLLSLQSRHTHIPEVADALEEARNRIYIMSSIYNTLYRGEDVKNINIKPFVEDISNVIMQVYSVATDVTIKNEIPDMIIAAKDSFYLGIIINELVTNAFKYAFDGSNKGTINVCIKNNKDTLLLQVADDGHGLPEIVVEKREYGFGLTLVSALLDQKGGKLDLLNDNGAAVSIEFPLSN